MTLENYFFANKNIHWSVLGISFIGISFFGPYLLGFTSLTLYGLPISYGLISAVMLVLLGWFFIPFYANFKLTTIPEYFEKRFNKRSRYYISALYIFSNIFIRLNILLIAGGVF